MTTPAPAGWLAAAPAPLRPILAEGAAGARPPSVTLARLLFAGAPADGLPDLLAALAGTAARDAAAGDERRRLALLADMADSRRHGLRRLGAMVAGVRHDTASASEAAGIEACRAMFDRLVALDPASSVAAWSLGDPGLLDAATAELVACLAGWGLLGPGRRVLDLGCGIGRVTASLAPAVGRAVGIDIAPGMVAAARDRCAGFANVDLLVTSGRDLAPFRDGVFDLVLAVDSFPYLVQAGPAAAARHVAEAARVLRPGGDLVILNYSYRDDDDADRRDLTDLAASSGFAIRRAGIRPFATWDGLAFHLHLD